MPDAPSTCKTGVLIFCLGEKGVEGRFFNFIELNQSHHDFIEVLGTYLKIFQLFLTYFNFIIHNNKRSRNEQVGLVKILKNFGKSPWG